MRIQFGSWVVLITLHTFAVLTTPSAETPVTANDVPFPIVPISPVALILVTVNLTGTTTVSVPNAPTASVPVATMVIPTPGITVPIAPAASTPVTAKVTGI